jgi:hypothetical protein
LVPVGGDFAGDTIAEALTRFEREKSDAAFDSVKVLEERRDRGGFLVKYEVRWRHSVFDEYAYGSHEAWAKLTWESGRRILLWMRQKRFRVVAAEAANHIS